MDMNIFLICKFIYNFWRNFVSITVFIAQLCGNVFCIIEHTYILKFLVL